MHKFIIYILLISLFSACQTEKKTEEKQAETDSLAVVYLDLSNEVEAAWDSMMAEEDKKIVSMKRLLEEVSYTNEYDEAKFNALMDDVNTIKDLRVKIDSMETEDIDFYDSVSTGIITKVNNFAKGHPKFNQYPLMQDLIDDIYQYDNQKLIRRNAYDAKALEYNQFIKEHGDLLGDSVTLVEKPVFILYP